MFDPVVKHVAFGFGRKRNLEQFAGDIVGLSMIGSERH